MASTTQWHVDDIDDALAADFDGSLSGLGMELGTASFNMSDALMALPNLSALKQENSRENGDRLQNLESLDKNQRGGSLSKRLRTWVEFGDYFQDMTQDHDTSHSSDSRIQNSESSRSVSAAQAKKTRLAHSADEDVSSAIKRFCVSSDREDGDSSQSSRCRHSSSVPDLRATGSQSATPVAILSASVLTQMLQLSNSPPTLSIRDCSPVLKSDSFQYVLGAATSIATKVHEETMTYLNQGQSYEIKLKKLGDLTEMRGKMLKSIIRIGFQERRLQYMEKEQIVQWQQQRLGERILEIDIPLSYGVYDVLNDPSNVHMCEFLWDPTKETGVFIRVNCISTEFTPKKHGGEKGVPFRIQIETFSHGDDFSQRLHVSSCQVKVFKPKGADRKHKTDREKMSKRPQSEQEKYKPSYDCTVFTECTMDSLYITSPLTISASTTTTTTTTTITSSTPNFSPQGSSSDVGVTILPIDLNPSTPASSTSEVQEVPEATTQATRKSPVNTESCLIKYMKTPVHETQSLSSEASATETAQWLQQQRFGSFVRTFSSFSGADILRLTRDDLIQICGLADGIRLFNALHSRAIRPRLTMYVCLASEQVFRAIYLENLTISDLVTKLAALFILPMSSIHDIYVTGPSAIHVLVTDEVIQNMSEEAMFVIEMLKDETSDSYRILLKPYTQQ